MVGVQVHRRWFVLVGLGVVVSCVAAFAALAASGSSAVAVNGRIAWKSFAQVDGRWSIYAANPDGSHPRRLTHPGAGVHDDLPDWSPDGSNILFMRLFQPNAPTFPTVVDEIMRVNADGSGLHQVGTCTGRCVGNDDPQYSRDGRRIVFMRALRVKGTPNLAVDVWVMDSNGSHPRVITEPLPGGSEDHEPAWSPDGKNIVFTRVNDTAVPTNQQALFIVSSNGGTPHRVTSWTLNAGGANWSPDESKILFQSYRDCSCSQSSQAYTIAPDGSGLSRLTSSGSNIEPNWSPDGKKIVYAHQLFKGANQLPDLWTMNADGSNKQPVIQTTRWDSEPDWGTAPTTP